MIALSLALAMLLSTARPQETADSPAASAPASQPKRIEANGLVFDVRLAGPAEGELVVLLHGFPQTSHAFRHQVRALAAAGYRVLAPDQRGYSPGARPTEVEDYALHHLVADVLALVDELEVERFHVVGHDWGAAVAWFTALSRPERVRSVAALSVPHPFAFAQALADPAGDQAERSGYMQTFRAADAEERLLADDAALLRGIWTSPGISPSDVEVYLKALGSPEAIGAALNWYRAMGVPGQWGAITPIELPTLYVWSTEDPTMGRAGAELTADFVRGPYRFEVLEGVSHWIPEEAPERVSALLLEHLRGAADAGSGAAAPPRPDAPSNPPGDR